MSDKLADMTPEEFRSEFLHLLDMYSDGGIGCDHLADKIAALRDADRAAERDIWVAKMERAVRKAWENATEATAEEIAEWLKENHSEGLSYSVRTRKWGTDR